jgi:predicted RNA binding protein YcfA (HicA-like mRNA interferase family)
VKLPRVTADAAIRVLERLGFGLARQSGAHKVFKNAQGQRATVPYHSGRILKLKVLKSIIRDAGVTVEEFTRLLKGK